MPKTNRKPKARAGVVRAQMTVHEDGTASFHVRGYDFRFADMPIAVNGYLFAPVRLNDSSSPIRAGASQRSHFASMNRSTPEPGSLHRVVSLPVELAQNVLKELYELRGERDWWKHELRYNYQHKLLCDEISQLEAIIGRQANFALTDPAAKPKETL